MYNQKIEYYEYLNSKEWLKETESEILSINNMLLNINKIQSKAVYNDNIISMIETVKNRLQVLLLSKLDTYESATDSVQRLEWYNKYLNSELSDLKSSNYYMENEYYHSLKFKKLLIKNDDIRKEIKAFKEEIKAYIELNIIDEKSDIKYMIECKNDIQKLKEEITTNSIQIVSHSEYMKVYQQCTKEAIYQEAINSIIDDALEDYRHQEDYNRQEEENEIDSIDFDEFIIR